VKSVGERFDPARLLFVCSVCLAVFGYGAAVGRYQIFPFDALQFALGSAKQVFAERDTILGVRPSFLVEPARHAGNGVTRNEKGAFPGLTLLVAFFEDELQFRLIRMDGTLVNRWPANFRDIFPDPSHIKPADQIPQTNWNAGIQGGLALPDGSIVFTFEGLGAAKLDRCGAVQWTVPKMTHHSVEPAADGGFWMPSARYVEQPSDFRALAPPYIEDTIVHISADGRVLQEIGLLSLLATNRLESLLFANGLEDLRIQDQMDMTHLNDVEELSRDLAGRFPQFAAGDLLISLRNYNLLLVADPRTQKVKWSKTGPWIKQHDPDFESNGRIGIFNNNADGTPTGSILGGSELLEIDPQTGETQTLYGAGSEQKMYTNFRGRHQRLPNGNILVTESQAGRVFEIDANGTLVWEFINRFDEESVAIVGMGARYSENYFDVTDWSCR